ncbi:MAG: hypothetical protein JWP14_3403 [Frankiales bacterium]|nr:hypothetical protein [Frankiales bacterium]
MAWVRNDDQAADHPKVLRAASSPRPKDLVLGPDAFAGAVYGLVSLCASWSASKLQDGWVPESQLRRVAGRDADLIGRSAVRAGFLSKKERRDGDWGWWIVQDDLLFHIRSKAEIDAEKKYRSMLRNPDVYGPIRKRDGDQCRYCGVVVIWKDNKSARGGLLEHVIPGEDDLVVACRGCNGIKGDNPPEAAGLTLQPPPREPYYSDYSRNLLIKLGQLPPELAATGATRVDPAATGATDLERQTEQILTSTLPPVPEAQPQARTGTDHQRAGPEPPAVDRGLPDQPRAGSGRVGSGAGQDGRSCLSTDLPTRARGDRARRTPGPPRNGT